MGRSITVKGVGNVSVKPDLIIISIDLESHRQDYRDTMQLATNTINELEEVITGLGFKNTDLKTTNFNVSTHYESYRDQNNNYLRRFDGYICEQSLKLEFDLDTQLMGRVLTEITNTEANPQISIHFSVKDKTAINEQLLISATQNARSKAEILCKASNLKIGDLLSIDYNWGEIHLISHTRYNIEESLMSESAAYAPDIHPDDIEVSDTVSFVWAIK